MSPSLNFKAPPTEVIHALLTAYEEGLAAIRTREAPVGLLYHYCDANALLSILRNREAWASDTSYLNDTTELISVFGNVRHHLKEPISVSERFVYNNIMLLSRMAGKFRENLIGLSSFVCCFSEDGDLLSQWRAYGSDGTGFAIGFDPTEMRILADGGGGTLKRMLYSNEAEKEIINEYYNKVVAALAPLREEFTDIGFPSMDFPQWLRLRMSEFLHEVAFEVKHPAFSEEREWRIIAGKENIHFRASKDRIIPYKLLDMSSTVDTLLMPIKEIVIGPRANKIESERALTYLAAKLGYGHSGISLRKSSAPYR